MGQRKLPHSIHACNGDHNMNTHAKNFFSILLVVIISLGNLSAMCLFNKKYELIKGYEDIIDSTIEYKVLDHKVILHGSCSLDHSLKVIPPYGQVILTANAELNIQAPITYQWNENSNITDMRKWLHQKALILFFSNKNSIIFNYNSKINIHGGVIFLFSNSRDFMKFNGKINLHSNALFEAIFVKSFWEKIRSLLADAEQVDALDHWAELITPQPNSTYITELFGWHEDRTDHSKSIIYQPYDFSNL